MKHLILLLSAAVSISQASCGHGNRDALVEADQPNPTVSVNIIESSVTVETRRTFQFHFDVANTTYPTCTWAVNGVAEGNAAFGTITDEGLYTAPRNAPTPNTVKVKATATADPTKFDTATVTINSGLTKGPPAAVVNLAASRQLSGNSTTSQTEAADPRNPNH
jgi:hypothetical protein